MNGVTRVLSRYVATSQYENLPSPVRHEGLRAFVNWVGCAAGGSRDEGVRRALEFLSEYNGARSATVVGRDEKLDALNAACVNSMSSAVLAFNDTHYVTVAHPTSPVAAALLALAQDRPVNGQDFLHALILGVEIQCRVGNILCVSPAECGVGLSMQGLVGGIGAAVAASKVLGLDESGVATAIGIASNQVGGLREAHATMSSSFIAGQAARAGLMSALLASRGFTCSDTMIEGAKGFAVSYGQRTRAETALDRLGEFFEISTLAYKPYPSGFVIHPIIDACLEAAQKMPAGAPGVERIDLTVNLLALQLCNRPAPRDSIQALVSFQHWAAVSVLYRAAGLAQVTEAVVREPDVAALRARVHAVGDERVARAAAHARVVLKDGTQVEAHVARNRGSAGRPLTDADITAKTLGQLQTAFPAAASDDILAECWRVENYPRVDRLCALLERPD